MNRVLQWCYPVSKLLDLRAFAYETTTSLRSRACSSVSTPGSEASPPSPKRRGRPPKAKPVSTEAAEAETPSLYGAEGVIGAPDMRAAAVLQQRHTANSAESSSAISRWAARRRLRWTPEGLSTLGTTQPPVLADALSHWHSGMNLTEVSLEGTEGAVGSFVDVPSDVLPEGEASFYYEPLLVERRVRQPNYGCKATTAEFEASGRRSLLHRASTVELFQKIASREARQVYVNGWTGAGKSIALYSLAAVARQAGWIVMYVPSATLLTQGGRFHRSDIEGDNLWDTPEAARHLLNAILGSHRDDLQLITSEGKTLADVATEGIESTVPRVTVQAALAVKDGLLGHDGTVAPTMVIIDEYNALYSATEYHEPMHAFYRRPISPDELRLASGFRILDDRDGGLGGAVTSISNARGVAVAASTFVGGISPQIRVPKAAGTANIRIPRFDLAELATAAAARLSQMEGVQEMPAEHVLRRTLALTNGNAREFRKIAAAFIQGDDPLGMSLGYKVAGALKKQYNISIES